MPYYRICPYCHAYLDFGERCDCQDEERKRSRDEVERKRKKAAPDATNIESGKVESELSVPHSTSIVHHNEGGNQE